MNVTIENQKLGGDSLHPVVQRVRSFVIWHTAGLMNLVGKIHYADLKREIGWREGAARAAQIERDGPRLPTADDA